MCFRRAVLLALLGACIAPATGPADAQETREERARRRLERTVASVEWALQRPVQLRAQLSVTESPLGPDAPGARDAILRRQGTIAHAPGIGTRAEVSAAFPTMSGSSPIELVGLLSADQARVMRIVDDEVRFEPDDAGPSDWQFIDILRAFDQVRRPGLDTRFEITPATGRAFEMSARRTEVLRLKPLPTNPLATRIAFVELVVAPPDWYPISLELIRADGATLELSLHAVDNDPRLPQRYFDPAALLVDAGPADLPPGAPGHLHVVEEEEFGYQPFLYWNAPDGNAGVDSYILEMGWFRGTAERGRMTLDPRATSYQLPWIPSGPMFVRLVARNEAGESGPSNEVVLDGATLDIFNPVVARPRYGADGPVALFDQAHHNYLGAERTGRHFLGLLRNDGYRLRIRHDPLDAVALGDVDVLIIANPYAHATDDWYHRGYEWWKWSAESAAPALTGDEVAAVVSFVCDGGSLLLAVGGAPWAGAASELFAALNVDFRNADARSGEWVPRAAFDPRAIHFARPDLREQVATADERGIGTLAPDHPIIRGGGDDAERLWTVWSYLGQSIIGPPGSSSLLDLPTGALDWFKEYPGGEWQTIPADGRSQAVAFALGAGRVVVVADAAAFFARGWRAGGISAPMAMAWPDSYAAGIDRSQKPAPMNRQFALNVMHWLSRSLR